jgi:thymidylate synthase ThyX
MAYAAKVIADSISESGCRLTTMEVTFPRMVLAEFNTHRTFSRNSASSRAIPVEKQLERIMKDPFVPDYWGVNQSGMQATTELEGEDRADAIRVWLEARDSAVDYAKRLLSRGIHKQLTNRLLEPFMWHTVIVTATDWGNFYALRANKDAQPEIRIIAEMMKKAHETSKPVLVKAGEWHLPLIQHDEYDGTFEFSETARQVSAARCARVSYLTHDGKRDYAKDLELYERLVGGGHMSPLEHVATPHHEERDHVDFSSSDGFEFGHTTLEPSTEMIGNFRGWKQLRKFVQYEDDFSKVAKEG